MSRKSVLGLIAALVLIAAGLFWWRSAAVPPPASERAAAAATVTVGANLPMSGDLGTYGTSVRDGALIALEARPAAGASPAPSIAVDWQDNAGDPKNALTILQRHLLAKPDIYMSGVKPQTMAIKAQVTAQGLPHFVWIFDAFINADSRNNFRTWVSYKIEPPIYLAYAKQRNAKRVAIIYVQLPHTIEEFDKLVVPSLRTQGSTDLLVEPFEFGKKDFKDVSAKVRAFKPDLLILNGFQAELVGLVRALRPLGLIKDGNTIATYDMLDAATILGADETEGIRQVAPLFVTRPDQPRVTAFRDAFRSRFNREPLYTHAFGHDSILIIREAARRLTLPATSAQWIDALRAVDMEGVTGRLKFDDQGDLQTPLEVAVYRGGRLVPEAQ